MCDTKAKIQAEMVISQLLARVCKAYEGIRQSALSQTSSPLLVCTQENQSTKMERTIFFANDAGHMTDLSRAVGFDETGLRPGHFYVILESGCFLITDDKLLPYLKKLGTSQTLLKPDDTFTWAQGMSVEAKGLQLSHTSQSFDYKFAVKDLNAQQQPVEKLVSEKQPGKHVPLTSEFKNELREKLLTLQQILAKDTSFCKLQVVQESWIVKYAAEALSSFFSMRKYSGSKSQLWINVMRWMQWIEIALNEKATHIQLVCHGSSDYDKLSNGVNMYECCRASNVQGTGFYVAHVDWIPHHYGTDKKYNCNICKQRGCQDCRGTMMIGLLLRGNWTECPDRGAVGSYQLNGFYNCRKCERTDVEYSGGFDATVVKDSNLLLLCGLAVVEPLSEAYCPSTPWTPRDSYNCIYRNADVLSTSLKKIELHEKNLREASLVASRSSTKHLQDDAPDDSHKKKKAKQDDNDPDQQAGVTIAVAQPVSSQTKKASKVSNMKTCNMCQQSFDCSGVRGVKKHGMKRRGFICWDCVKAYGETFSAQFGGQVKCSNCQTVVKYKTDFQTAEGWNNFCMLNCFHFAPQTNNVMPFRCKQCLSKK